jgi:hypothetical protein
MRLRKVLVFAALVALIVAGTVSAAYAVPSITSHGISGNVAWGLKSMQYAYFFAGVTPSNAWVKLEILNSKGVVATVYQGAVSKLGKDKLGRYWSPRWYGKDKSGKILPTGVYNYRWTVASAGSSVTRKGNISVSRVRFSIGGAGTSSAPAAFERFLYKGSTRVYYRAYSAETTRTYTAITATWKAGTQDFAARTTLNLTGGVWSPLVLKVFNAPINHSYLWMLIAAKASDHDQLNGSRLQVTVMQ